tara:strand:- start:13927 stop:15072 length:1146 start_codon:yes stop_codon:yes gene_type:complete
MQKNYKENYLQSYAIKSKNTRGRIYNELQDSNRSPYQRDRDRIIHSSSFRRLKHKTQVFVNTVGDHYRTRLTHSMEVSQIARTISRSLSLNEDLTETLSLAHDLGHTPFGHAGEEVLNECMNKYGGFNHNIQTLRIVTSIENKYYKFNGLNLTIETLDGLFKHNGAIKDLVPYKKILKKDLFNNKLFFNLSPSLEAQVAAISDDIAYNNHDLEDGLRAKLFNLSSLISMPYVSSIIKKHSMKIGKFRKEIIISQIVRDLINLMVIDVIKTTKKNLKRINPHSIQDIYKQDTLMVDFSPKMKIIDRQIKDFLNHNMYNHKTVIVNTNRGKKIINDLFKYLLKNPKRHISGELFKKEKKERVIADFIAGMTDRYAINLRNKIK